jgi:hypothetical protein
MNFPAPAESPLPIDTVAQLLTNALVDAGIVGIDESIEPPVLNRAFTQVNWLLAQWARKRSLVYQLFEYAFQSTGALNYPVGLDQTININPRPDRLEYAYLRLNGAALLSGPGTAGLPVDFNSPDFNFPDFNTRSDSSGGSGGSSTNPVYTPVDIRLSIIPSKEDYSRITVKTVGNLPWRIFYDPGWPIGTLYPWPVPAPQYQIFLGFKVVLPRFRSLQQRINFPPEYEAALNWALARRLRTSYQMPPDPEINALARDALNTMRLANQAAPTLMMPDAVIHTSKSYSYQSDNMPG